jgi:hypothetical protein
MNFTRRNASTSRVVAQFPVMLAPIMLGNHLPNGAINTDDTGMWELNADYGGWNNTWHNRGCVTNLAPHCMHVDYGSARLKCTKTHTVYLGHKRTCRRTHARARTCASTCEYVQARAHAHNARTHAHNQSVSQT